MKQHSLLLIILLAAQVCIAQPTIVKNDATQVLYIGANNPVTVRVDHYKPAELTVKVSTGNIYKTTVPGKYNWTICENNDSLAKIKIYCGKQFIKEVSFLLLKLPDAVLTIGHSNCRAPVNLKMEKGIRARIENHILGDGVICKVINFKVTVTSKDKLVTAGNDGAFFTPEVFKILNDCRPGSTVVFEKILYQVGCEPMFREFSSGIAFNIF